MKKRFISIITVLAMLTSMLSTGLMVSAAPITQNQNSADGVMLRKSATPNPDGTVDITIDAYTTGSVVSQAMAIPSDIVLVLDVSGSMDETMSSATTIVYNAVNGTAYSTGYGVNRTTYYGFRTGTTYYVQTGTDAYTSVSRIGDDSGDFIYYKYTDSNGETQYVYPIMGTGINYGTKVREFEYPQVQFYTREEVTVTTSQMEGMHKSVGNFIDATLAMNQTVSDDSQKHRMAIVKYASDSYYSGSEAISDIDGVANAVVGNDTYEYNNSQLNYTQLIHDFDVVDADGDASLKAAVNDLQAGGATAVDYGVRMAQYILNNRTLEEKASRNEVVVVFSDGTPTHWDSYDENVANTAIAETLALKNAGVQVYTLSVLAGANGNILGTDTTNQFMHYLSSNYPDAASMASPGTGTPDSGYYMTPSEENTVTRIFEQIIQNIGKPNISLGTSTIVTDTLSPYFNLTNEITPNSNITIETISKKGPASFGESSYEIDATVDPNITVTVGTNNRQILVSGFDFDANYITDTAKGDGTYGKILRITINVTPDYGEIDNMRPRTAEVSTNLETAPASILNPSQAEPIATTLSPTVIMNKVSYEVDGASFANGDYDVYRLPGSDNQTTFNPSKEGHTFSGWSSTDVVIATDGRFEMPDGDVVIEGTFATNKYNITYSYTGAIPSGTAPVDPSTNNQTDVNFGTLVNVASNPTPPAGYSFSGWQTGDATVSDESFTMPDNDVNFTGYFTANGNTPYKIEHYLQNVDGTYPVTPADSYFDYGETDTTATAVPKTYEGFEYDTSAANIESGIIAGDGSLVLKFHYKRLHYTVSYVYEGTVPTGTSNAPLPLTYTYGETVYVEAAPSIIPAGYTFSGWSTSAVTVNGGTFTMPNKDIQFEGSFTANGNTEYTIEHYLQNLDGTYPVTPTDSYTDYGTTDTTATAEPKEYIGFTFDFDNVNNMLSGTIAGDGSLVLKLHYTRNSYNVDYSYVGTVPADATDIASFGGTYKYGETVTVKDVANASGYTFHGWISKTIPATSNETFEMPAHDVLFDGHFVANGATEYKVEHYLQNLDGTDYELDPSNVKTHTGETDTEVTAIPIYFEGFLYNAARTGTENSGIIAGDGSLVLRLYYDREAHNVSYTYIGIVPANAPSLPVTVSYRYGTTVDIEPDPVLAGYDFNGWESFGGTVGANDTTFTMPNQNVQLRGQFIPRTGTAYKVHHIGEGLDGVYDVNLGTENLTGTTDAVVTATPKDFEGFTYNAARTGTENSGTIAGDGSTELYIYYSRDSHQVNYTYIGIIPAGSPSLPATETYKYGDTVIVKPDKVLAGYTFEGWSSFGGTVSADDTTFTMPDQNVQLRGQFIPNSDTEYVIEHWTQKRDGAYELKLENIKTHTGITGTPVTALPIDLLGYKYNDTHTDNIKTGTIAGDGTLVLKLHYDRNPLYTVTYLYTGTVPAGAPVLPATETYIQGETVTLAVLAAISGYDFSGWTSYGGAVQPNDRSFTMPNRDVSLSGHFIAKDTTYKVNHYHQTNGNIDAYTLYETEDNIPTKVGAEVIGVPKTYAGYVYSIAKTGEGYRGKALPDDGLTLNIYYDKIPYTVTYSYYGVQPKTLVDAGTLPTLPTDPGNKYMGESIAIKSITDVPAGYTFQGWYSSQVEVLPTDTTFTMPEQNVTLLGRLVPATDTPYKVEHYTGSGNSYTLYQTDDCIGTTGDIATATPITISGYTYYPEHTETVLDGIIWAEPTLVLKLYYKKNSSGGGGGGSTPSGYVEITKKVSAPEGAVDDNQAFTFDIMKEVNGRKEKIKTVTIKADETKKITLDPGTYYIYEQEQNISGYLLKVNSNVVDNKVEIKRSATSKITFENVYTTKSDMLEKDDHYAYIVGYPDGNVRPNAQITRAEVATIFFRMMTDEARAEYRMITNPFSDVTGNDWYNVAVSTLSNAKILDGYLDGTFKPNSPITRAELSKIAASFYKMQTTSDVKLSDISGHWAEDFIKSAHSYGFINGYPDNTFKPDQPITRAETMKIVNSALERMPNKDHLHNDMIRWPDNSNKEEWYYADVQEATNSHTYTKGDKFETWTGILPVRDWAALEITK